MRTALRALLRTPTLSLATIATIAIGVGATSAMFGIVSAVLLRPLPYRDPGRLVMIWEKWQVSRDMKGVDPDVAARLAERSPVMTTALDDWRKDNRSFEAIAGFLSLEASLTGGGEPERVQALAASSELFSTLGIAPALGRAFKADEDVSGRDEVAVISDALWVRRFGSDPGVLGRMLGIDGVPHAIVGVLPRGFHFTLPRVSAEPDVIVPIPHSYAQNRKWSIVMTVARLKPEVTIAGAQADMSALYARLAETNRRYRSRNANVVWLTGEVARDSRLGLLVLFGATGCVLLIGCINVANLLLLRAAGRSRELAIRTALGAGRWRLTRQVVGEAVWLASAGAAAGLVLATWGVGVLLAAVPQDLFPRIAEVRIDPTVLAFGFVVSLLVGLAASIAPIWHTLARDRRGAINRVLAGDQRTSSEGRGQRLTRRTLVVAQVAIAMVLLVGAGLLADTYVRLTRVDLGVDPDRVLTFELTLPPVRYGTPASLVALQEALIARLAPLPGVEAAGLTNTLPVQPTMLASMTVEAEGQPASEIPESVNVRTVSPGFFRAAGVRAAYGRLLAASDATADVAVINRVAARRFWPAAPPEGPDPVGRKLRIGTHWCTIVGVVEDVKYAGPAGRSEQEAYVPLAFWPMGHVSAVIRTSGDPMAIADLARQAVRAIDPDLPVQEIRTMETVVSESIAPQRFRFMLIGIFAAIALALAVIGIYGVIAQSVGQRAREMGIRMALGAGRPAIARLVLAEGFLVVGIGVILGVGVSVGTTRVLAKFLFGVTAIDPPTYTVVALGILLLSGVAMYGPTRRATRSDPAAILRGE